MRFHGACGRVGKSNRRLAPSSRRLKRSFLRRWMSSGNGKQALQFAPSGLLPGLRGRRAHAELHQGGRGAVHHPVGREPADQGARGPPRPKTVRAAAAVAQAHRERAGALPDRNRRARSAAERGRAGERRETRGRTSAPTGALTLGGSLIDLAIRYCKPESVPEDAVKLFGEEVIPVCSRALLRDKARPLKRPQDLAHHTLLHFDYAGAETMYMDWGTWLTALGIGELPPAGALPLSQYEPMIQAAISGQGGALGRQPLVSDLIESGALVAPFKQTLVGSRAYFIIESRLSAGKPQVSEFAQWLLAEAGQEAGQGAAVARMGRPRRTRMF